LTLKLENTSEKNILYDKTI